jgi:hypothetical protein
MQLLDVNKVLTTDDPLNSGFSDAISFTKRSLGDGCVGVFPFNLDGLFICQNCISGFFAFAVWITLSFSSILSIFFRSSKIKMSGITARRIITVMQHPFALGNFSISKLPCNAMSAETFTIKFKSPLSKLLKRPNIIPAFVWGFYDYFVPKSLGHRCSFLFPRFISRFTPIYSHIGIMWKPSILST